MQLHHFIRGKVLVMQGTIRYLYSTKLNMDHPTLMSHMSVVLVKNYLQFYVVTWRDIPFHLIFDLSMYDIILA